MTLCKRILPSAFTLGLLLTGCGSDDQNQEELAMGASYTGKESASALIQSDTDQLAAHAGAVVKAITFYKYEESIADYSNSKHLASVRLAQYLKLILDSKLPELENIFGSGQIDLPGISGACGGQSKITGAIHNLLIQADGMCEEYDEYLSLELSGKFHYQRDGAEYSLQFSDANILLDYANTLDMKDERIQGDGFINYLESSAFNVLEIHSSVNVNAVCYESNVKLNCINDSDICEFSADVLAENGITYRIKDLHSELKSSGYYGFADLYIPNIGKTIIEYHDISYCESGEIRSGSINLIGSNGNGVLTLDYLDCGISEPHFSESVVLN